LFEGHVNALLLIEIYGTEEQKRHYFEEAHRNILFGVWNSELPGEATKIKKSYTSYGLTGAKIFCSGANEVHRPIITAEGPSGKQMVILDLAELDLEEDYTYWDPMGMKGSVSCRFDFTGISVTDRQLLGEPGDYEREPDFSGGASRFAAVQLGGASTAIHSTLQHLLKLKRADHPDQLRRLGQLAILQERGMAWLQKVAHIADNKLKNPQEYTYYANIFRTEVRLICEEILHLCELSVGLQGLMVPHPLERIHRDLSVYLKQPGPDRALAEIGTSLTTQNLIS
jgi:alkylation response protein AidB-like acyl-CoA dehydrogenase